MSLINCPECGKEISDQAVSCPNCGCPINEYYEDEYYEQETYNEDNSNLHDYDGVTRYVEKSQHVYESMCTCLNCGNKFSYTNFDIARDRQGRWADLESAHNLILGSKIERAISLNHQNTSYQVDFHKCPNCGSKKISIEHDDYYVDENGEYIENYIPSFSDKVSDFFHGVMQFISNLLFKSCLFSTIAFFAIILFLIIRLVFIFI